ncbi:MAG: aldo/keto reductase [Clostridium perfringens]|nr:aldo/keto reductase [Clostridium perfringens]
MEQTYITLNDGTKIPQFGLGVFLIEGDENTKKACLEAINLGYRHIDTAHAYQNERGVGAAIKESGIDRKDMWITTKLWPSEYGEGVTLKAIDKMLERLDTDYIDLLLLHQQFGDYLGAWKDMEKAVALGKVRSIGLSNFESERLEEVLEAAKIKPSVIQVECHPYYQQDNLKERINKHKIAIESWYPIGHADKELLNEEVFTKLANKYNKTNIQVILRWHIQEGNIVFPKTTNIEHMKDNIDIFDFSLTADEMKEIKNLDRNKRFFTLGLKEQEEQLSKFVPAD